MPILALILLACGADPEPEPAPVTPTVADTDTDDTTVVDVLTGSCAAQADNTLRYDCTFTAPSTGAVSVEVEVEGEVLGPFTGETGAPITLWGLIPEAEHTWRAWRDESPGDISVGGFTTAAAGIDPAFVAAPAVAGTPATDAVLVQFGCDRSEVLAVVDALGRVRWYEDPDRLRPGTEMVRGFEVTEDGTVLALYDNDAIVEMTWAGEILLDLRRGADFDRPVHHDVVRRGGLTFALDAGVQPGVPVVWDGFTVFDDDGLAATWTTEGVLDPAEGNPCCSDYWRVDFPDAVDFAHANSIGVDEALNVYVGFRYIDAVVKVTGDPAAPDFGAVHWVLVGDPDSPIPSDLALTATAGGYATFGSPHHVRPFPGGIGLYDNGWSAEGRPSRVLDIAVDEGAGTADIVAATELGLHCPIQGSAFPLSDGTVLTVCSGDWSVFTVEPGTGARTWQLDFSCPTGELRRPPYRAVPVDLPGP